MSTDIALAASARQWPDRLHRFLLDHGGGRIVERVMAPDQALAYQYDILLIDDVCSFLTPSLVVNLKQAGVEVVGVYVPEDGPDAKRRLLECGISDVIETEATPEEFLAKIESALAHRSVPVPEASGGAPVLSIGITGAAEGVGITETAVSLARAIAGSVPAVLVDLDQVWPSIAQRLDLPVHPNIRTALDHAHHRPGRIEEAVHVVGDLRVVGGRADAGQGAAISRADVLTLMGCLSALVEVVIADLGPAHSMEPGLAHELDSIVVVGRPDPVGVARMIRVLGELDAASPERSLLGVLNMVRTDRYRRAEANAMLSRTFPDLPFFSLPFDGRLQRSAWDGLLTTGGRYWKAVRAMSDVVVRSVM